MKINRSACMLALIWLAILGCAAGDFARIKTLPANESKVTQQELIDNWSVSTIWLRPTVVVFDPKAGGSGECQAG